MPNDLNNPWVVAPLSLNYRLAASETTVPSMAEVNAYIRANMRKFEILSKTELAMQMRLMAKELETAIRISFARHDKTGQPLDDSDGYGPIGHGSVLPPGMHTIDTLRIDQTPGTVDISMGGAAWLVEGGTVAHPIPGRWTPTQVVKYRDKYGEIQYRSVAPHPGYRGDPFMERAIKSVNVERHLNKYADSVFQKLFIGGLAQGYSETAFGIRAPSGQFASPATAQLSLGGDYATMAIRDLPL